MTARELREKYFRFFELKGHKRFPSGTLVPYDVTGRLDESLLFNGAGMIQFKPYFRGAATPEHKRLITAQKCVRTGDIDVTGDLSHLTFFEMMGNFSFGDYFKKDAIAYSWEFMFGREWLGLDPKRVCVTIFEEDEDAYEHWEAHWSAAGFEPANKIFRLGEETNYWPAGAFSGGPPGPCGPNSEMFFWPGDNPPSGPYTAEDYLRDEAEGKWLEFWNDVFIQYEWQGALRDPSNPSKGYEKKGLVPLPFQSIDTGMGLERTSVVLGGLNSIYDIDLFQPILRKLEALSEGRLVYGKDEAVDTAMRINADHIRTAVFCIAEGILPGNNGRRYVLRRLIRRAILKGQRVLGFGKPYFHALQEAVAEALGDHYTELVERRDVISETLLNEEELFLRTLREGTRLLTEELENSKSKVLAGDIAFRLYDTFGFPLEVTQEICDESGVTVDVEGYQKSMHEAQERSRAAGGMETVYGGVSAEDPTAGLAATEFLGYTSSVGESSIVAAWPLESGETAVVLASTPFYADSGGQVGDVGTFEVNGRIYNVTGTTKKSGVFVHRVKEDGVKVGDKIKAAVSHETRAKTQRNHTATHLMHAALRQVLGKHVAQAGSYVGPDRLRFDFSHGKAMTPAEIQEVEEIVNREALENIDVVTHVDIPIDEARKRGAMALFGEKYGDKVRMVEIGEFSRELCGGTHVRTSGEIGLFKIIGEASAASGVRRIEAVTGEEAYALTKEESGRLKQVAEVLKTSPKELIAAVDKLQGQMKDLQKKLEKARSQGGDEAATQFVAIGQVELGIQKLSDVDTKDATLVADRLVDGHPNRVALIAAIQDGKITFIVKTGSSALASGAHAGNIVKEVAKLAGGGGGGRAEFATAGGRLVEKVDDALAAGTEALREQVKA